MHNSQEGQPVVRFGGWGSTGSPTNEPEENLLISDCIGCHTNAINDKTIITIGPSGGESHIPIVYNASVEPDYSEESTASGSFQHLGRRQFLWFFDVSCGFQ